MKVETKDEYTLDKIFCFNLNVSTTSTPRLLYLVSSSLHLLSVELTLCTQ